MRTLAVLLVAMAIAGCRSDKPDMPVVTDAPPHIIDTVTGNKPAPIVAP